METYEELRRLAAEFLKNERAGHTLQATALVHDAFLRILKTEDFTLQDQGHLFAFAARAMRRILISYGVARTRQKRGGVNLVRLPLDQALDVFEQRNVNLELLEEALDELTKEDSRKCQVVELRFFGGFTIEEIAAQLGISVATVKREWSLAKLWLRDRLRVEKIFG
ncbi:MAG: ECF-type sigma factor [Verrucomicrobiota bacterium]